MKPHLVTASSNQTSLSDNFVKLVQHKMKTFSLCCIFHRETMKESESDQCEVVLCFLWNSYRSVVMFNRKIADQPGVRVVLICCHNLPDGWQVKDISLRGRPHALKHKPETLTEQFYRSNMQTREKDLSLPCVSGKQWWHFQTAFPQRWSFQWWLRDREFSSVRSWHWNRKEVNTIDLMVS